MMCKNVRNRRLFITLSLALLVSCVSAALARASYSAVISFGDSLSDVGNVYDQSFHIAPQSPPFLFPGVHHAQARPSQVAR